MQTIEEIRNRAMADPDEENVFETPVEKLEASNREEARAVGVAFRQTEAGQLFERDFDSPENLRAIADAIEFTGRALTVENLVSMFTALSRLGKLKKATSKSNSTGKPAPRDPISGEFVPQEFLEFAQRALPKEHEERKRTDAAYRQWVENSVRAELRDTAGLPRESRENVSDEVYEQLRKFAYTYHRMSTDDLRANVNVAIVGKPAAEKFQHNMARCAALGLI